MRKIDRLGKLLVSFGCDRWVHLVVCLVVSWTAATLFNAIAVMVSQPTERVLAGLVGVAVGVVVAIAKEVYDKKTTNLFDEGDLAAGFVGIALFYLIYCV